MPDLFLTALHIFVAIIGALGNGLVVYTLTKHRYQSLFANVMLVHQSILDVVVCIIFILLVISPIQSESETQNFTNLLEQNSTSKYVIDLLACHLWYSQMVYWYFVFASVQNLILIAIDRYLAVFRTVRYKSLGFRQAGFLIFVLHCYALLVNIFDIVDVKYNNETTKCESEVLTGSIKGFGKFYGILWFFLVYVIPVVSVFLIYLSIIIKLTSSTRVSNNTTINGSTTDVVIPSNNTSRFQQRAATELTKSTAVITLIFIVCFAYDSIYYLFGHLDIVKYKFGDDLQLAGVFLVALNSCLNPLVYCIIMKSFRQRLIKSFGCCSKRLEHMDLLNNTRYPS